MEFPMVMLLLFNPHTRLIEAKNTGYTSTSACHPLMIASMTDNDFLSPRKKRGRMRGDTVSSILSHA